MFRRYCVTLKLASGLLLTLCCVCGNDPTGSSTGSIQVLTQTSGATAETSLDTDGYTVVVDNAESNDVESNGSLTLAGIPAGEHIVELQGLQENRTTTSSPDSVTVAAGATAQVSFAVTCWAPAEGRIVFDRTVLVTGQNWSWESYIYVMNGDGTNLQRLADDCSGGGPVWSPDDQKIAFAGTCTAMVTGISHIYVMNADGSGPTKLTDGAGSHSSPTWSPDGSKIAFHSERDDTNGIFVMNADGSDEVQIAEWGSSPAWSPDGSKIAYTCEYDVCVMNSDGSGSVNMTNTVLELEQTFRGSWSPDGEKILFNTNRSGTIDLFVMNADGTDQVRFVRNAAGGSWSPDGTKIIFSRAGLRRMSLYYVNADGTGLVSLTEEVEEGVFSDRSPSWGRGS